MIEYILNGKTVKVSPGNEEAFLKANPSATKKTSWWKGEEGYIPDELEFWKEKQETESPGKSQEAGQPQINQQKNTESILEDGSLGSLGSKPSYTVGKESVTRDKIKELLNDKDFIKKIMEVPGNTINVSNDDEIQELMSMMIRNNLYNEFVKYLGKPPHVLKHDYFIEKMNKK